MTANFPYKRLPGVRRGVIRKASLWEGSDHLFSISGTRFSEQYRRFYYRDIQALVVQKSARPGSIGVWVLAGFACAVCALIARTRSFVSLGYSVGLWMPAAILALYLVYRLIVSLYYSCRCYIQTAVTWEELPSLYRVWNTRKALQRIRVKIAEAQGTLDVDPQTLAETREPGFLNSPAATRIPVRDQEELPAAHSPSTSMNLVLSGCIVLLVIAVLLFWRMDTSSRYADSMAVTITNALLTLLAGMAFVFSLLRIYKIHAFRSLRNFLFAVLGLLGLHVYCLSLVANVYSQSDPMSVALQSTAFRHWFNLIDGSFNLLSGIFGVALIVLNWQNYSKGSISNS